MKTEQSFPNQTYTSIETAELERLRSRIAELEAFADYDPEDVSAGDLEILREARDGLAELFCAIPADRVLGETEVKVPGSCVWSKVDIQDERSWSTTCQHVWSFEDGGPSENNANFCPFCGGKIEVELDSGSNQGGSDHA